MNFSFVQIFHCVTGVRKAYAIPKLAYSIYTVHTCTSKVAICLTGQYILSIDALSFEKTCRITGGISSLRLFVRTFSKINKGHSEALSTRSAYQYEAYACAPIFSFSIEYTSPCFTFRLFTISSTSFNFCEQVFHLLSRLTSLRFLLLFNFLFVGDVPSPLF